MNLKKLKAAEKTFLKRHPLGFNDPELVEMGKKHKMARMISLAQEDFAKARFKSPDDIVSSMAKIVSRSSMVSMFDKPKFKRFAASASTHARRLSNGLREWLHGKNEQKGFESVLGVLQDAKIAKWPLLTICPIYFRPDDEAFVKPTAAKGIIDYFELEDLQYRSTPTWDFYRGYRAAIVEMRSRIDSSLAPNNAALAGFLMMSLPKK